MKSARKFVMALVTAPDLNTARKLVKLALKARLVACGNIIPKIESHYWWQGRIDTSAEVLILFKTTAASLDPLERLLLAQHPYDTPEIMALTFNHGTERYLNWLLDSTSPSQSATKHKREGGRAIKASHIPKAS